VANSASKSGHYFSKLVMELEPGFFARAVLARGIMLDP
jgi:hypothetical protein